METLPTNFGTLSRFSLYNRAVSTVTSGETARPELVCPICGETGADARYAIEGFRSNLVVCRHCGTGWLEPMPSPEDLAEQYPTSYYGETGQKFHPLIELGVRFVGGRHVRFLARRVPPGGRVLDVGCGRGILLRELADRGYETHGFERFASAVRGIDPRVQVRIGDSLMAANYPDHFFDQVIVWHVLEHIPDPKDVLREIHRILKPGGEVVIAVPNFSSLQAQWSGSAWFHLDLPRHLFHFPHQALRQLMSDCGFEPGTTHHFSLRQNPFGWVQSALNRWTRLPRNSLYELIHARQEPHVKSLPRMTRFCLVSAFVLGMPVGLFLEILATLMKSGATIHVTGVARGNEQR